MMPIARVLVADCAWEHDDKLPGDKRGAAKHYNVMSTDDLCVLRIPPTEPDALLFFWCLSNMLDDALRVVRAWGFTPKSSIAWVKLTRGAGERTLKRDVTVPRGITQEALLEMVLYELVPLHFGMGRYVRNSHESCIIASRGRGASLIKSRSERSVLFAPVGEHSAKPEKFYAMVERLSDGPYVELFARRKRRGWTTIGDELGSTLRLQRGQAR